MRNSLPATRRARGAATIEYALTCFIFFLLVFGTLEVARALYLWNTMAQAVQRVARGAATINFNSAASLETVRQAALFRSSPGSAPLGGNLDTNYLQVAYLAADGVTPVSPLPPCPLENVARCMRNAQGSDCIRFVRVRLCQENSNCTQAEYPALLLPAWVGLHLPTFETLVPVSAFGHQPGADAGCT